MNFSPNKINVGLAVIFFIFYSILLTISAVDGPGLTLAFILHIIQSLWFILIFFTAIGYVIGSLIAKKGEK